jgi:hypothetical protein
VAGYPKAALADAKFDVVAPIGGDIQAGSDQTDEKSDDK